VGDSEANLKRVFSDYRRVWERMEVQPILFLNECDQIIGRRLNAQSGVEQMQNGLQNLVLEEMETFGGILIGTTNLTQNMDPAFERRWTIKLQFDPPNTQAVAAIWKSQIKGLRQTEAELLANAFALTPGEISNIARRFAAEKLLGLEDTRLNTLIALCETERYHNVKASGVPLGFRVPGRQEMDMQKDRRKAG
jgi:SpoVK/Ycf46/Vps4 family AAA+-type ATPase